MHTCRSSVLPLMNNDCKITLTSLPSWNLVGWGHELCHAIYCSNFLFYYNKFLACDCKLLEIYWNLMKIFVVIIIISENYYNNLAENMCDCKTIMINVPIIQCCRRLLLSQFNRNRTHNNLVVHIRHVRPLYYHSNCSNIPRLSLIKYCSNFLNDYNNLNVVIRVTLAVGLMIMVIMLGIRLG